MTISRDSERPLCVATQRRGRVQVSTQRNAAGMNAKALMATVAALSLIFVGGAMSVSAAPAPPDTGFNETNAGVVKYQPFAPTEATRAQQVNAPLTQKEADRLARLLGFDKDKAFTKKQYAAFVSGKGRPAGYTKAEAQKAAQLTRLSVEYLSNTTGNTYTRIIDGQEVTVNLGSYGLIVDKDGMLRVPANCPEPSSPDFSDCSPVRQINWVLAPDAICDNPDLAKSPPAGVPCGYMGAWMRSNKARDTLKELYGSAYAREIPYASQSQDDAGISQLIYVTRPDGSEAVVGVPVAPAMWNLNYLLVYALDPEAARYFPAYWESIPEEVVSAIQESPNGQVAYADFMDFFAR